MKKLFLLIGLISGIQAGAAAQSYLFQKSTGTYAPLPAPTMLSASGWGSTSYAINIGFPFMLGNEVFTSLELDSDGFAGFTGAGTEGWIDGFYADLQDRNFPGKPAAIGYQLSGEPGNRVLKLEWKNAGFAEGAASDFLNFQIWLYENSQTIELHYGPSQVNNYSAVFGHEGGPDIGLVSHFHKNHLSVDGIYLQGYGTDPEPLTLSNATAYPSLTTVPKNGTVYIFTPAPILPAFAEEIRLTVYPNPVTEVLQIEGFAESGETVLVKIYDAMGRVVLRREEPAAAAIPVNLQALRKGAYYVELNCGSRRAGKRIIKM